MVYSHAVSLLFLAGMYDDAERTHLRYAEATGGRLRADVMLDEIREAREAHRPVREDSTLVFRRLTLLERGHFSNHFTLRPVTKIAIGDEMIKIWRRRTQWTFPWTAVRVSIAKAPATKAVGRYSYGRYMRKLCTITADGETFRFDVSDQYPDLASPRQLIEELERHVRVEWSVKGT